MSINRRASAITERVADFITFNQTETGGVIGAPSSEQQTNGFDVPNVQAAIDDLFRISLVPVGTAVVTVSDRNPSIEATVGVAQKVKLTITGTSAGTTSVLVAGVTVPVLETDTPAQVATKIAAAIGSDPGISSASASGAEVTYEHEDTVPQPLPAESQGTLTITSALLQYSSDAGFYGYGSWEYIGSTTIGTKTLYNWIRVA